MIEENTIVGNTNGIFVAAGVQGNVFRSNLVVGNPGVQVSVDHPSSNGFDIQNMATPGANAFEGNTCITALNAPCPSAGPSMSANPNPISVAAGTLGQTTISWSAPDAQVVEIHLGSPSGSLFTNQGNRGSIQTGVWVSDGMTFYLQDVTGGKPLTADYTLATLVVHLQPISTNGHMVPRFGSPATWWTGGTIVTLIALCLLFGGGMPRRRKVPVAVSGAVLLATAAYCIMATRANAQSHPSPQDTSAALDRMVAAHKGQQDIARYIFDTQGCKTCHTLGQGGKLGFTSRGQQVGGNYEGCIRLLTDVSAVAKIPDSRRTAQQRSKTARFDEFGCTFCHQVNPDKVGLTAVGSKLANMHLGCVEVEKQLASAPARR